MLFRAQRRLPGQNSLNTKSADKTYSYDGFAYRYTDYKGNEKQGFDWHIYNHGQTSIYIQAYDSTYIENVFDFPAFEATLTVELPDGKSKIYQATAGQFRITGQEMWDVLGDFHFKVKNIDDPLDSTDDNPGILQDLSRRS